MSNWQEISDIHLLSEDGFVYSRASDCYIRPTATNAGSLRINYYQKSIYLARLAKELFGKEIEIQTNTEVIRQRNLEDSLARYPNVIWKPIYDTYLVSNLGNLIDLQTGCIRIAAKDGGGYNKAQIKINNEVVFTGIYRLVAIAFIPNPENKPFVNRIDGNKENNTVDNLEWCTPLENSIHAHATGLVIDNPKKLNEESIREIREMFIEGKTNYAIGRLFNVDPSTIRSVREGRTWSHIK